MQKIIFIIEKIQKYQKRPTLCSQTRTCLRPWGGCRDWLFGVKVPDDWRARPGQHGGGNVVNYVLCKGRKMSTDQSWARAQEIQLARPVEHPVKHLLAQIHYIKYLLEQSWALSVFLNFFNNKKWFFAFFIQLIRLGVGFLNRNRLLTL